MSEQPIGGKSTMPPAQLWKTVGWPACSSVVLSLSWQQFELLRHGYRLEEMQRSRRGSGRRGLFVSKSRR